MTNDIPLGDLEGYKLERRGKKGIYTASYWHGGKHHRKSLKTTNLKEAQKRLRKLAFQIEQGEYKHLDTTLTIAAMNQLYLDHLKTERRAPKTMVKYTGQLNDFGEHLAGIRVVRANQILPTHMDHYRSARREMWSPYTLYNRCVIIKQLTRWATKRGLIAINPLQDYDLPKPKRPKHACPQHDEVKCILQKVPSQYWLPVLVLACSGIDLPP